MRHLPALLLLAAAAAAEPPRLAVVVVVDQMRPDTLTRFAGEYRGGLKRLLDGGRRFRGVLDHAATQTGPGHSTILSGCRPDRTGIVANGWLDRATMKGVYCTEGDSPETMLRDTLGDWLRAAHPGAKVVSVSGKDRAAILMGGRRPTAACWFRKDDAGFATSAWYEPLGKPAWLEDFNGDGWLDALPEAWTYEPAEGLRADDDPRESPQYGRASPHPLRASRRSRTADAVYRSPYVDEWTLRLARATVDRFELGRDATPDLLAVALSATDTVGHLYGPFSQEIRDCTLRLDRHLGDLFAHLDASGAPWVAVLTADHGVLPLDPLRRVDVRKHVQAVAVALQRRFGAAEWFRMTDAGIYVDRRVAKEKGADPDDVAAAIAETARGLEGVAAAYDRRQLSGEGGDALLVLARRSWHPERGADVLVIAQENVLITDQAFGTSHGSPHAYDREVPIVFWGPGIRGGDAGREARTIDIAPTLARLLGVAAPGDLDGEPVPLE